MYEVKVIKTVETRNVWQSHNAARVARAALQWRRLANNWNKTE